MLPVLQVRPFDMKTPFFATLHGSPLAGSTGLAFLPFIRLPEGRIACLLFTHINIRLANRAGQPWTLVVSSMSMRDLAQLTMRFSDLGDSLAVKEEMRMAGAQLPNPALLYLGMSSWS